MRVITFGTFDLFHIGHLRILERASEYGNYLIVGISSDELNMKKKNKTPIYTSEERKKIISSLNCVDEVFFEETIDKREYCLKYKADILVMGDDIPDIPIIKASGVGCCPQDAAPEVKSASDYVSQKFGGKGCVRDVIEQVMKIQNKWI